MKIKTKLQLLAVWPVIIFFAAMSVLLFVSARVDRAHHKGESTLAMMRMVSDLITLTYEYGITKGDRARIQWTMQYHALEGRLKEAEAQADAADEKDLITGILRDCREAGRRFEEITEFDSKSKTEKTGAAFAVVRSNMVNSLILQIQDILPDIEKTFFILQEAHNRLQKTQNGLIVVLFSLFALIMPPLLIAVVDTITKPIDELQKGMEIIASGNLDHRVKIGSEDEIGALARGFDDMTEKLKLITVSRSVLQQEIVERKRAEEELQRLNRELRAVGGCNQVLVRAEDEQTLLHEICRIICDKAGYRMAWVGYAEQDGAKTVRPVAWAGNEDGYLAAAAITWADTERGRGPTGTAIRTGQSDAIRDFATDAKAAPWRESALQRGYRSSISLPLKDEGGATFGALTIYSSETGAFTAEERRLLEELAGDLAFGITVLRGRVERREAERSVALMNFALNNVREAAFLIDEKARFRYVNDEACRALGYSRAELNGMSVADVDPDFPAARWPEHWSELKEKRSLLFEGRHRAKGGQLIPVEISANYFEYEGQGYNLALVRDVTERRRMEAALRTSEQNLALHVMQTPLGVIEWDLGFRVAKWNPAAERIFGYSRTEALGKHASLIVPQAARGQVDQVWGDLLRNKGGFRSTNENVTKDGALIYCEWYNTPLVDDDGNVIAVASLVQDVTDRRRAEEELRKLNEDLEKHVRERTEELEAMNEELRRLNRLFVGRELRMVELKEQIRKLGGSSSSEEEI